MSPLLSTGLLAAGFLFAYVAIHRGDFSCLICADRTKIGTWPYEAVRVGFPPDGYDGQYYYVLARDPRHRTTEFIDQPACRHSRIAYCALAWAGSGGDPRLLLYVLPFINWLAIIGIAWLGTAIARHYDRSPWWGFALVIGLNAIAPALRDLTDPLATFFGLAVLTAHLLNWKPIFLLMGSVLALLAREQNLTIVGLVFIENLIERRDRRAGYAGIAIGIWLLWIALLRQTYGRWPFLPGNLEMPFSGLGYRIGHMRGPLGTPDSWLNAVGISLLGTQFLAFAAMLGRGANRLILAIAATGIALAVFGGMPIYSGLESYTRVFWCLPLGIWLWGIRTNRRWPGLLIVLAAVWPCYSLLQAHFKVQKGAMLFLE